MAASWDFRPPGCGLRGLIPIANKVQRPDVFLGAGVRNQDSYRECLYLKNTNTASTQRALASNFWRRLPYFYFYICAQAGLSAYSIPFASSACASTAARCALGKLSAASAACKDLPAASALPALKDEGPLPCRLISTAWPFT